MKRSDVPRYAERMERSRVRPADPAWITYGSVALALTAHALWWWVAPGSADGAARAGRDRVPVSCVIPSRQGVEHVIRQTIRSPSLFALPSRYGFHVPVDEGADARKHLIPWRPPSRRSTLTRRVRDLLDGFRGPTELTPPAIEAELQPLASIVETDVDSPFPTRSRDTAYRVDVMWQGEGGERLLLTSMDVDRNEPWVDERPWEVIARVVTDDAGWPREVFFEKPSSSKDRNAELLRLIHHMNIPGAGAGDGGRITVQYRSYRVETDGAGS